MVLVMFALFSLSQGHLIQGVLVTLGFVLVFDLAALGFEVGTIIAIKRTDLGYKTRILLCFAPMFVLMLSVWLASFLR